MAAPSVTATPVRPALGRILGYLRRHPVICLLLLTPGIPEYLSGSSSPAVLAISPPIFLLFLALNVGMYTGGVLLVREARVRWRLGWASVFALGMAYGILEEGFALTTLFDPHNAQINAATAVSWAGVNWGWSAGILPFHALFSVALPIFLLDRALPETRGRSLVEGRALALTVVAYLATIVGLGSAFALHTYWMGWPVFVGGLATVGALILLGRNLPRNLFDRVPRGPDLSVRQAFLLGASYFPVGLVVPGLLSTAHPPVLLLVAAPPAVGLVYLYLVLRSFGSQEERPGAIVLAGGLIAPFFASGAIVATFHAPVGLPLVFLADVAASAFVWRLYRNSQARLPAPPPAAALAASAG